MLGLHVLPCFTETVVAQVAARLIFPRAPALITRGALDAANVPGHTSGVCPRGRLQVRAGDLVGRRLALMS